MRLRATIFALIAFAGAGYVAWAAAERATAHVEQATAETLSDALEAAGQGWASVATDGLQVAIMGYAPDEQGRIRALEVARRVVDPARLQDAILVRSAAQVPPPDFSVEFLRNEGQVSLIGLLPGRADHGRILAALRGAELDTGVTDMLEIAEHQSPEGWDPALEFALQVLGDIPRARISAEPGTVGVIAVTETHTAGASLEAGLRAAAPSGLRLDLNISAPRPVIVPFRLDYQLAAGRGRLAACSAETPEDADAIRAAARGTVLEGAPGCDVGLGAPSPDWAEAAGHGIAAVQDLGGGRFEVTDTEATLTGPDVVDPEALRAAGTALSAALPAAITLTTVAPPRMEASADGAEVYAPRFEAIKAADGHLEIGGAVQDATSQAAIESFAAALFGHERVVSATVIDPALPEGWPVRVLAGIEALSVIEEGSLAVTPDSLTVAGRDIVGDGSDRVTALLAAKGAGPAEIDIRFDAEAARLAAERARPAPERCATEVAAILQDAPIDFAPGSAEIDEQGRGVIAAISDVLRGCPGARFEVAGHTDSQGRDEVNLRISEERAIAVAAALRGQDLPLIELSAVGFGAAQPLADNETPEGRERNRRIEITLRQEEKPEAVAEGADAADAGEGAACAAAVADILAEDRIVFPSGSSEIDAESEVLVSALAQALAPCPSARFEIGGHTDDSGSAGGNLRLSADRANAVRTALIDAGIAAEGLVARGFGEEMPLYDNTTSEGRAGNRRIEIQLLSEEPEAVREAMGGPQ